MSYAPHPEKGIPAKVLCPHCGEIGQPKRKQKKPKRKRVPLAVLLCPKCDAVWQWRGELPEGEVKCPACGCAYDPLVGNVPAKGKFLCSCGNVDKVIESIRRLPQDQRLPVRPYAIQAYLPAWEEKVGEDPQISILLNQGLTSRSKNGREASLKTLLLPKNGKFFKSFSISDTTRLQKAETLWGKHKDELPFPKSSISIGYNTNQMIKHHYNLWHEMFLPRQLFALATLLDGIMEEADEALREILMCSFSGALEQNNEFCRYMTERRSAGGQTLQGVFAQHDFQPKSTITENNVFGIPDIGMGSFESKISLLKEGVGYKKRCWEFEKSGKDGKRSKVVVDGMSAERPDLKCLSIATTSVMNGATACITDPPYVGNVNYSELSDFYYVWLRLALKDSHPWFAPEYTPKAEEIVENKTRGKSRGDFFEDLTRAFDRIKGTIKDDGLLIFTFHHTDEEGTIWEGLLGSICEAGFELIAVYPIHGESESSLHLMDKENVSYDLIHVCRKRRGTPERRTWAGLRQEVRRRARDELKNIENGRYGKEPLSPSDVRLICIGKCLEFYSRHYGKVLDHEGKAMPLHAALQDIGTIVDQLVTKERPLPPELEEDIDPISYMWFRVLMEKKMEINFNDLSKALRGVQVSTEDLKKAGLIIKGRIGRGRFFNVKQPEERLTDLKGRLEPAFSPGKPQFTLFDEMNRPIVHNVNLVDVVHLLIGLAWSGESVVPWLERYSSLRPKLKAALSYVRDQRKDWKEYIDRVMNLLEGKPLLRDVSALPNSASPPGKGREE